MRDWGWLAVRYNLYSKVCKVYYGRYIHTLPI